MPILVRCSADPLAEWGVIELQGDLEVRDGQIMQGHFVGDLCYSKSGQPILIIGHHILQGKEVKMDRPYAVLEKVETTEGNLDETINLDLTNVTDGTVLDNTILIEHKTRQKIEYRVKAIARKKLLFRARPKPIIANVPKQV